MEPTIAEMIFYGVLASPLVIIGLIKLFNINLDYDPNANDPYRYCPKD